MFKLFRETHTKTERKSCNGLEILRFNTSHSSNYKCTDQNEPPK
jgi:hypothetical protein